MSASHIILATTRELKESKTENVLLEEKKSEMISDISLKEKSLKKLDPIIEKFKTFHSEPIIKVVERFLTGHDVNSMEFSIRARNLMLNESEKTSLATWIKERYASYLKNPSNTSTLSGKECALLGWIFIGGIGVPKDSSIAMNFYKAAAQKKDAYGLGTLGNMYLGGINCRKSISKAREYYEKALALGSVQALNGLGTISNKLETAIEYHSKAAQAGYAEGYYHLGKLANEHKFDSKSAFEYYQEGAARGCTLSLCQLAFMYKNDFEYYNPGKAALYFRTAAEYGFNTDDILFKLYLENKTDPIVCYHVAFALINSNNEMQKLSLCESMNRIEDKNPGIFKSILQETDDNPKQLDELLNTDKLKQEQKAHKLLFYKRMELYGKLREEKAAQNQIIFGSILQFFSKTNDKIKLIDQADDGKITCTEALRRLEKKN